MREYRDKGYPDEIFCRPPAYSAWIAAASLAFAFFVLGGFIKTYRQLESLREESRREIRELRAVVESLRSPQSVSTASNSSRVAPLPRARRIESSATASSAAVGIQPRNAGQVENASARLSLPEIDGERQRFTYTIGRTSSDGSITKPQSQVVAVNNLQKRIMVEGGRNLGLGEGSRLELSRQGKWIGDLRVLDVFDTLSFCEVLHATLPPEPGDIVRLPR